MVTLSNSWCSLQKPRFLRRHHDAARSLPSSYYICLLLHHAPDRNHPFRFHTVSMLPRIFTALTALLFARCITGDTIRVRQMPGAFDAAFSDWASIFSISDDLGSYFNDVAINKPGAADDWEVSHAFRNWYSLLIENTLACACTDTEYYQPHQRFRFTATVFGDRSTSCPRDRSFDLD